MSYKPFKIYLDLNWEKVPVLWWTVQRSQGVFDYYCSYRKDTEILYEDITEIILNITVCVHSVDWEYVWSHSGAPVFTLMDRRKEIFYLTTHSTHFIYGYMASDIWLRTILIVRKETRFRHISYSFRLTARVLLYAPSHRQDSTYRYHGLCYTSRGSLAGTRNSSMGPSHEGSIRRPITPWANALTTELHLAPWNDIEYHRVYT